MTLMLRVLLAKDLRRAWRNPVPYLIFLAVPLVITALLGFAFGGSPEKALGRIRFAVVDEDESLLTQLLRGAANQGEGAHHLEPVFLPRAEALHQVTNNQLSAALIIPKNFTRDYLLGGKAVKLELVKNPAQSFHPAILEELAGALVTGLNALARSFRAELDAWRAVLEQTNAPRSLAVAIEVGRTGAKIESVANLLFPPAISYTITRTNAADPGDGPAGKRADAPSQGRAPKWNLFAYLLPGLAAMFLLFLADVALRDFYREVAARTFERFCSLPQRVFTFVASKVLFSLAMLMICGVILFGGGALLFQIHWTRPLPLAVMVAAFGFFAGGFMAALTALAGGERRSEVINNLVVMLFTLASGCAFPAESLPGFLREHVTPWLPPNLFLETARRLQFDSAAPSWTWSALQLAVLGLLLVVLAAWRFQRRLEKGLRA
ncbi:MAG: ABC transporter permease [Verrucomicrobia bacterium]|nr:ABC transporter permease [Verrucomicrobiota bacterium]